jgi:hypothetical protein
MRLHAIGTLAGLTLLLIGETDLTQRATPSSAAAMMSLEAQRALINEYCIGCHNGRSKSGGLALSQLDLAHVDQNAEIAEKVIRKLRAGMMPPPGAKRPDFDVAKALAASLETAIDKVAALHPNPGSRSFQRLSQTEYARSIHDLLGIDIDVAALLPPDSLHDGFDNIADAQSFSPVVVEGYMRAANKVVVDALGDPKASTTSATFSLSSTTNQLRHVEGAPMGTRGGLSVMYNFPADGEYQFTVEFQAATDGGLIGSRSANEQIEISINGERAEVLDINPNMSEATGGLSLKTGRIFVKFGPQRLSAAFIARFSGLSDDLVAPIEYTLADAVGAPQLLQLPHLQNFTITGPFTVTGVSESVSRRKVLTCHPLSANEEKLCARKIISNIARQAYRRPVSDGDMEAVLNFYEMGRKDADFEAGIRTALKAILSSPNFVFRLEQRPVGVAPGQNYPIGDLELASRLSYFIWSTAPDAELLNVAGSGRLHEASQLEKQVRRMLADRRSESLATRFAAEWLRLPELQNLIPDALLYPNFDRTLAQAMRRETELLFDSIVREDRNVLDLLTANYTFLNERLALHYKIPGILGERFRRVQIPEDYRRGLLGQGSILTLTSQAGRTSPVLRGKWVMEVLLGTPPPPPPPNVPSLEATGPVKDGRLLTVRERLESHRANAACSSCHRMIDPIGLSLENFDPTGLWRIKDSGVPVDPTTVLFDGIPAKGPADLRNTILKYSDAFIGNLTENMMTYAVGRPLRYYDMPSVRAVTREASRNNNRMSSIILGIVKSTPFGMSKTEAAN